MTKVDHVRRLVDQYPGILHNQYVVSTNADVTTIAVFNAISKNVDLYHWRQDHWVLSISLEYKSSNIDCLYANRLGMNDIGTTIAVEYVLSPGNEGLVCIWYLSGSTWRYEGLCLPQNVLSTYDIELKHDNLHTLKRILEC